MIAQAGALQDKWRYISVRRLLIMIEQSVASALEDYTFHPNDDSTWSECKNMISNFLQNLWAKGALQGSTTDNAYQVAIGLGKTMIAADITNGIMRVQINLAVVHPAEFIIITLEQRMATS